MSKIRIKNFGPIKEGFDTPDGFMDIKKVTVFIGDQGSGKSSVAKLITTFLWIEKALTRGDYNEKWFSRKGKLRNQFLAYFRLENYFSDDSVYIEYIGNSFRIKFESGSLDIEEIQNKDYPLPQIMYVPSERNFISNVKTPKALKLTSDSLVEFVTEFDNAKEELKGSMALPINNTEIEYQKLNDIVYIKGSDYKIKLTESSSGFQSFVPLYLVSWFLSNSVKQQSEKELMTSEQRDRFRKKMQTINEIPDLTEEQKRIAISEEARKFNKTVFINIVEEPEQNLFPTSQKKMLESLVQFNNLNEGNKLIITTHSPYIISYLSLCVKADKVLKLVNKSEQAINLKHLLEQIVPLQSTVSPEDLVIYELDEGKIKKLGDYKGIPSDKNFLNKWITETNYLFDDLLEIEKKCL